MRAALAAALLSACAPPAPTPGGPFFEDAAPALGLDFDRTPTEGYDDIPGRLGGGVCVLDVDGHPPLDLFFSMRGQSRLYLGGPTYADATVERGLDDVGDALGCLAWDADGDGDDDLLVTGLGTLRLFLANGERFEDATAQLDASVPATHVLSSAAAGDYDGDGDLDIFAFGHGGGTIMDAYVYRNDGGGFAEVLAAAIPGQSVGTADPVQGSIGDVNCDGAIDILAGGTVLLASGGSWSIATSVDGAQIGHLADMNGDGHLDVITHDASVGLALYLGDGTGTGWTAQAGLGLPDAAYQAGGAMGRAYGIDVGDVDNSDNMDIVRLAEFGADFVLEVWSR